MRVGGAAVGEGHPSKGSIISLLNIDTVYLDDRDLERERCDIDHISIWDVYDIYEMSIWDIYLPYMGYISPIHGIYIYMGYIYAMQESTGDLMQTKDSWTLTIQAVTWSSWLALLLRECFVLTYQRQAGRGQERSARTEQDRTARA